MGRFYGNIGYSSTESVETRPGIWEDVPVVKPYSGNVLRFSQSKDSTDKVNEDFRIGNSISVVADAYLNANLSKILYIEFAGEKWKVERVDINRPRLVLRLGGVYNGPTPQAP